MEKIDVYYKFEKLGIHTKIPREFDLEKDYYAKGVIRAKNLINGHYYIGKCRNGHIGKWDEENKVMWHKRFKHGVFVKDHVNYIDNDDGFDLFIAIEGIDEKDVPEDYRVDAFNRY